jgi:hypothetical protein
MSERDMSQFDVSSRSPSLEQEPVVDIYERLHPEILRDEDGIDRSVYHFQTKRGESVRVLFYPKGELPVLSPDESRRLFVFGEKPKSRTAQEWDTFAQSIQSQNELIGSPINPSVISPDMLKGGQNMFLVEQGVRSLLDMAITLGVDVSQIGEERLAAAQGRATDFLEQAMDQIIAANSIDDSGEYKSHTDTEGESLFLAALQGDVQAKKILEARLNFLKQKDVEKTEILLASLRDAGKKGEKALEIEDLVTVHMTRYLPKKTEAGYEMQSTFDGSGRELPRVTQHFSLNHPVESHAGGDWSDSSYAIISPLKSVIRQNGSPAVLNTVDTYWDISPGRRMQFSSSDTVIVAPASTRMDSLFTISDNEVQYKDRGISTKDVHEMCAQFPALEKNIVAGLIRLCDEAGLHVDQDAHGETAWEIIASSDKKNILQKAERFVVSLFRAELIQLAMKNMGYTVHTGGMWAWDGDSLSATEQTAMLGRELGVPVGSHQSDPRKKVEDGLQHLLRMKSDPQEFDQKTYHDRVRTAWYDEDGYGGKVLNIELLQSASPAQRRMMYQMGVV